MPVPSPFHERTAALCHSWSWKQWAGVLSVCRYHTCCLREYQALRHAAGLIDVSPLFKYEIRGPEAGAFLARLVCKDIRNLGPNRVTYTCWTDHGGKLLDDGTVARLGENAYRLTSSEPWLDWMLRASHGYKVTIVDSTEDLAALSLQGPNAREVLRQVCGLPVDKMRFFRIRPTLIDGLEAWVSRTGYTGDLGYEIMVKSSDALTLWDCLMSAGADYGLLPVGLDAMDMTRIEAGFVLQGVDYVSARSCVLDSRKSTPDEAGLGGTVELDGADFIGREAILGERKRKPRWKLVGLEVDWDALEALYDSYDLPPGLPADAWRTAVPIYEAGGRRQLGQATSGTWSPILKKNLALATLDARFAAPGTEVAIEHTVEYCRHTLPARVAERPFYDPPQKRGRGPRLEEGTA